MQLNDIRKSFLGFFSSKGHKTLPSSPLVPYQDPTLMFANSGMVQFKNYFTGQEKPIFHRVATSQKCVRAGGKHNDLDNVGYTARHHTFFEMLGNFSFGDYFKETAIEFAWEYLTSILQLPKEKLYITVYSEDIEGYNIWKKLTGFSESKIIKIATSDNFWAMGDTGPCGPCSEIFYDHGEKYYGGLPGTPEADGDRYVEIWNLVFMQYEQLADGTRLKLPKPSIDAGMGIERITAVMQGVNNNFDIDLFARLIAAVKGLLGSQPTGASHRVIVDHLRASCFLIADGVMPSNEGRGYVLRRIMRRAMRHIRHLGGSDNKKAVLSELSPFLVREMGEDYPELKRAEAFIASTLKMEEERFQETLTRALKLLNESIQGLRPGDMMSGDIAFKLYDTYGFPLDLTSDILRAQQISLNTEEFEKAMAAQKERAKAAWAGSGGKANDVIWHQLYEEFGATEFVGYTTTYGRGKILAIVKEGKPIEQAEGEEVILVLNQTPFYAESGGQVGDTGELNTHKVIDTIKYIGKIFGHHVYLNGRVRVGDEVSLKVDKVRRDKIRANHSATHLLHTALRKILGTHVTQKGSLVTANKLRFDFSHNSALSLDELQQVEHLVNAMIVANNSALTEITTPSSAIEKGAMALFGEKYEDEVRVVTFGESTELCGGTHVGRTGDIGVFKIISEESIAAGVRRIEAITGLEAFEFLSIKSNILKGLSLLLKCAEAEVDSKISNLLLERKNLEKELKGLKLNMILEAELKPEKIGSVSCYVKSFSDIAPKETKSLLERIKSQVDSGIILVTNHSEGKNSVLIAVTGDVKTLHPADRILKSIAGPLKAKGGGNADLAQAGCETVVSESLAIELLSRYLLDKKV